MSKDYFKGISPVRYEGPESKNALAYRCYDRTASSLGKTMEDHLRFAVCYWHSFGWPGSDLFGGETFLRPWMHGSDPMAVAKRQGRRRVRVVPHPRRAVLHLPRRDVAPEGATLPRIGRQLRRDRRPVRAEDGDRQGQAAVGHGQSVLAPPLHGGRRDQSRSRRVRLRRRDGEGRLEATKRLGGAELRAVGRSRGLRDAAQHRPQARTRPAGPLPLDGGRAQAQDRLQRPAADRAEAAANRPSTSTITTSRRCSASCRSGA